MDQPEQARLCSCTFTPCACEAIAALSPAAREAAQTYYLRAAGARRRRAAFALRELARTRPVERSLVAAVERRSTYHDTVATMQFHPNTVKSRQARRTPCAVCGVNDGLTQRLEGQSLHPEVCRATWVRGLTTGVSRSV